MNSTNYAQSVYAVTVRKWWTTHRQLANTLYTHGMSFTRRWKGRSKADVSTAMRILNEKRLAGMTKAQRVALAHKMVAGRSKKTAV